MKPKPPCMTCLVKACCQHVCDEFIFYFSRIIAAIKRNIYFLEDSRLINSIRKNHYINEEELNYLIKDIERKVIGELSISIYYKPTNETIKFDKYGNYWYLVTKTNNDKTEVINVSAYSFVIKKRL